MFIRTNNYGLEFLQSASSLKDADLQVNGVTVLKIDKFNHALTISRIGQNDMLEKLKGIKLVHVNLESVSSSILLYYFLIIYYSFVLD
jgi:hypothetical protein